MTPGQFLLSLHGEDFEALEKEIQASAREEDACSEKLGALVEKHPIINPPTRTRAKSSRRRLAPT